MNGKLIVLEGIDGSGKSSQYKKICSKLNLDGVEFSNIVFPRYNKPSCTMVNAYLHGEFGSKPEDVNAYTASTFYAIDRFASFKEDWGNDYLDGKIILSDRYTTSNAIHQGSKLPQNELHDFFAWLSDFEYNKMQLPKPNLVIYLDTTLEISKSRMRKRELETSTAADIHELDDDYLEKCLKTASEACDFYGWYRIPYLDENGIELSLDAKNELIYSLIKDYLNV